MSFSLLVDYKAPRLPSAEYEWHCTENPPLSIDNPRPALADNSAPVPSSVAGCAVPWSMGVASVVGMRRRCWFRDVECSALTRSDPPLFDDDGYVRAGAPEAHILRGKVEKAFLVNTWRGRGLACAG
jgi:hypothetical protein